MTQQQPFGGNWTRDKLYRLKDYLKAYNTILVKYPYFQTVYVDAFAGTGAIPRRTSKLTPLDDTSSQIAGQGMLFAEGSDQGAEPPTEAEVEDFLVGSARIALETDPPFGSYLFVERSPRKAKELEGLRQEYPERARSIQVCQADANDYLTRWAQSTNWKRTRAVVFLDPCGMQVEWRLLEALASTGGVDLWVLVPIGMGVNRLLTQSELPPAEWQNRLTKFFGTDDWVARCYTEATQRSLFDDTTALQKTINYDGLASYFTERLATIFPNVAPTPLTQRNSQNCPMFMLTFASKNKVALKIADYLLRRNPKQ